MLFDSSRLRGEVEHLDRRFEPGAFDLAHEDFRVIGPVHLVADARKDGAKVRLTGHLDAELECDCSRCLEPFPVPLHAAVDSLFLPMADNIGEGEREVQQDDLGVSFYRDDEIDLGDVMREQFLLAVPMKPLCREECKGLCPVCGVNLNERDCGGHEGWVDPRLEGLRKLRR
ncbi:MAG TPA: DUF177 domain-containing protein [Vicinamibacterales bacterium]|nr:DUF177 domain-containing protein [Vicinamibacterales bacterium]